MDRVPVNPRFNIYSNPHKALRLALGEVLVAAGRVDPRDDADVANLAGQVRSLLTFCQMHLEKEEAFVHPAMEARHPGSASGTQHDHADHLAAFEQLEADLRALEEPGLRHRERVAVQLYRRLALFAADNMVHMHREETYNNEALWAVYTDDELHALEQQLVASIPPEALQLALRWMMPAMNPMERAELLLEMRERVPAPAFTSILAGVQSTLTEVERDKLALALAA
jgi:hypothetical protein